MNTELIYSDFPSEKTPFRLKPVFGSMLAFSSALPDSASIAIPVENHLNQTATLPRITNEDVNTVNPPAKVPLLTNVYIGSLTVIGLFVLFRFIQKHP